jgi:hypothetical protein
LQERLSLLGELEAIEGEKRELLRGGTTAAPPIDNIIDQSDY